MSLGNITKSILNVVTQPAGERAASSALVRAREHRSEVMLSVLVVVFCCNRITILNFSAGHRQISVIALFHVLKAPFGSGRGEVDIRQFSRGALGLNWSLVADGL